MAPPRDIATDRIPFQTLVHEMLEQLGEDPSREGLRQTPARVEASLKWLTRGYGLDVEEVVGDAVFEEKHESMICVRDIEIYSMCEHHMLPFFGKAHVAYLPNGRIVGLSKIPRVVEVFARRLQVQERLTDQVAEALCRVLKPLGVGGVKIALVTGASRGIGLAVADALRALPSGVHVVRLARTLTDESAERRTDIPCDVTKPADVDRALDRVFTDLGVPDVLVNNAGIFFIKSLAETTYADFTAALATNLTGPFLLAHAIVPKMVTRGSGHLVTIGSISDYIGFSGSTAYAATKFGLRGMHEVIRQETAKTGVRTTLVSPGPVDTDIWDAVD